MYIHNETNNVDVYPLFFNVIPGVNENARLNEFNRTENIDGLTGNEYFINDVVVPDFKNNRFGVVN